MLLHRIASRLAGADPRSAERPAADLGDAEFAALRLKLSRLDAATGRGAWTEAMLRLIAERPATPATALARAFRREKLAFKADIRKLKALGLTERLDVGYRLSPRGAAMLARLDGK